ncbi:hypothetical protein PIB30_036179 [Stylosanthes scabra]|uniref:Uncharacterized protein n=1 Tax=Stylosanthes scabra TaxID=79078 RepID=A0ABU6QCX2_9FABA|nr:hypothetical protein [Stylosanthes scabra]
MLMFNHPNRKLQVYNRSKLGLFGFVQSSSFLLLRTCHLFNEALYCEKDSSITQDNMNINLKVVATHDKSKH